MYCDHEYVTHGKAAGDSPAGQAKTGPLFLATRYGNSRLIFEVENFVGQSKATKIFSHEIFRF